jgi:hypothetical protein
VIGGEAVAPFFRGCPGGGLFLSSSLPLFPLPLFLSSSLLSSLLSSSSSSLLSSSSSSLLSCFFFLFFSSRFLSSRCSRSSWRQVLRRFWVVLLGVRVVGFSWWHWCLSCSSSSLARSPRRSWFSFLLLSFGGVSEVFLGVLVGVPVGSSFSFRWFSFGSVWAPGFVFSFFSWVFEFFLGWFSFFLG